MAATSTIVASESTNALWTENEEILLFKQLLKYRPYLVGSKGEINNELWEHISTYIMAKTKKRFQPSYLLSTYKQIYSFDIPSSSVSTSATSSCSTANNSNTPISSLLYQLKKEYIRNKTRWNNLSTKIKEEKLEKIDQVSRHISALIKQIIASDSKTIKDQTVLRRRELIQLGLNFQWLLESKTTGELKLVLSPQYYHNIMIATTPRKELLLANTTATTDHPTLASTIDFMRLKLCLCPLTTYQEVFPLMAEANEEHFALLNELLELYHCKQQNMMVNTITTNIHKWYKSIKSLVLKLLKQPLETSSSSLPPLDCCYNDPGYSDDESSLTAVPLLEKQRRLIVWYQQKRYNRRQRLQFLLLKVLPVVLP